MLRKGRMSNPDSLLSNDEFELLRSTVFRLNWLGRECRPEAAGVASIVVSNLRDPRIKDVQCVNRLIRHLRETASRAIILWPIPLSQISLVSLSDAGGTGGAEDRVESDGLPTDATQGAWMILAAGPGISDGVKTPVSVLSWKSTKLRRRVSSTLAGETLALSAAIAEVEWVQWLLRDVMHGDVLLPSSTVTAPFSAVLRAGGNLDSGRMKQLHVVDAKSCYDALARGGTSSARDRRTAIELAIVAETLSRHKSRVRWVPHGRMPVDPLTKADISSSNAALCDLIRSGHLCLVEEAVELAARREGVTSKSRSQKASRDLLAAARGNENEEAGSPSGQ